MTVEGVVLIQEGMNPRMLESRLRAFIVDGQPEPPTPPKLAKPEPARSPQ